MSTVVVNSAAALSLRDHFKAQEVAIFHDMKTLTFDVYFEFRNGLEVILHGWLPPSHRQPPTAWATAFRWLTKNAKGRLIIEMQDLQALEAYLNETDA